MTQEKKNGSVLDWEGSKRSEEPSQRSSSGANRFSTPDPEVAEKARRRRFSARYKLKILEQADRCREAGEVGALLRREGLYTSHLSAWRKARREGTLQGLTPKKRGARPTRDPKDARIHALEAKVTRLEKELDKAHTILDVQGKVAGLLGLNLDNGKDC